MTEQSNHLDIETLSAFADSEMTAAAAESAERHVAECAACRDTLRRVRALVAAAHALPRDVAPPQQIWSELSARVRHERRATHTTLSWWRGHWAGGWFAAAAAIVLLVGSSVLMPRSAGKAKATKIARQTAVVPAALLTVDNSYVATVAELHDALESERATLSPATVRIVERSLATIDTAIAEAREALASDPSNQRLVEILSANYRYKVELLQRATELSSTS